jgi:hypothetical protein
MTENTQVIDEVIKSMKSKNENTATNKSEKKKRPLRLKIVVWFFGFCAILALFPNAKEKEKKTVNTEIQKDNILSTLEDISIDEKYLLSWYVDEITCVNDDCTQIRFWLTELPDWYKEFSISESPRLIASIILNAVADKTENKNIVLVSIRIDKNPEIMCTKARDQEIKCE